MANASSSTRNGARTPAKSAAAFRTISEVAEELDLPQHVLRFWETKFDEVKPLKRGGGRRYYRPEDIDLLRRIQYLLYEEGYTIKGVQKLLSEGRVPEAAGGTTASASGGPPAGENEGEAAASDETMLPGANGSLSTEHRALLRSVLVDLRDARALIAPILSMTSSSSLPDNDGGDTSDDPGDGDGGSRSDAGSVGGEGAMRQTGRTEEGGD